MRRAAWVLAAAAGVVVGGAAAASPSPPVPVRHLVPGATAFQPGHVSSGLRLLAAPADPRDTEHVLWNFTAPAATVSDWVESSDGIARKDGMSTGAFKLQKTAQFQRAVFFSLLNPQPNGAGFVGFYTAGHWDLSQFRAITLQARAQGENLRYKVYLKHRQDTAAGGGAYEAYFQMPAGQLTSVTIPLDSFLFFYRGRLVPDAPPLDRANITRFGLQIYGGVYSEQKQSGVSALEIDWITASR